VAFMSFTYAEYAALKEVPSMEVLLSKIVEKYPLAKCTFVVAETVIKISTTSINLLKTDFRTVVKPKSE